MTVLLLFSVRAHANVIIECADTDACAASTDKCWLPHHTVLNQFRELIKNRITLRQVADSIGPMKSHAAAARKQISCTRLW